MRLKVIGSVYEYQFPWTWPRFDNKSSITVFTYRVEAHDSIITPDGRHSVAERVEPISSRERRIVALRFLTMSDAESGYQHTVCVPTFHPDDPPPTEFVGDFIEVAE